ncbi:hypothetical protein POTOM_042134 [Populus tomentosa]|uniref:Uncharacterized protein n=1 Tax=Populus tomentosa TaxID=118781 RepID=A0A8X7YNU6_POPTO|nr:hypothetical protein POTOM_042134 [Populus tomentosa]
MAFVTHQMQGSYATFPSRPLSWSIGLKLKPHVTKLQMFGRTDMCFSVKRSLLLSAGAFALGPKVKLLRISAFKGSAQNDESGGRTNGSKVSKNYVKLSYVPKENGETIISSSKTPSQDADEILEEGPPPREELQQAQNTTQNKERVDIVKLHPFGPGHQCDIWSWSVKELTPLWILGPLIVAIYIKLFQGLWTLYVFSFRQIVKLIKNAPAYYLVASGYIRQGKLKDDMQVHVLQPVLHIQNLDRKEFPRKKTKELQEWLTEKYLDYVESIWPYYCRAIRFLKKANLI